MTAERLSRLMRAGGALSALSGTLHIAGSARALVVQHGEYLGRGPYLLLIGLLLITSGLTLAWAAGGVRDGAPWGRGATVVAAAQALGLVAIVGPGFIVHFNALAAGPALILAVHAFFLWQVRPRPAAPPSASPSPVRSR